MSKMSAPGFAVDEALSAMIEGSQLSKTIFKAKVHELEQRKISLEKRKEEMREASQESMSKALKSASKDIMTDMPAGSNARKPQIIKLNVGGRNIDIRRETVTKFPSRLAGMLSGRWDHAIPKDKSGRLFLDLDPEWFEPIINHLRELILQDPEKPIQPPAVPAEHKAGFECLVDFFGLREIFFNPILNMGMDSTIIKEPFMIDALRRLALSKNPGGDKTKPSTFKLLYRGSRDGFTASAHHERCCGVCNTMTVVKDNMGSIFGGFSDVACQSGAESNLYSSNSFLFSLSIRGAVDAGAVCCSSVIRNHHCAVKQSPSLLASFGSNPDLHISDQCNMNSSSGIKLGGTYEAVANQLNGGNATFKVKEIEVFEVKTLPVPTELADRVLGVCKDFLEGEDAFKESVPHLQVIDDYIQNFIFGTWQLHEQSLQLKQQELELEEEISFMKQLISQESWCDQALHFNVGGTLYSVSKRSLRQAPESMLCTQYCSARWEPHEEDLDDNGNIFLDMNPHCFGKMLSKLRFMQMKELHERTSSQEPCDYGFAVQIDLRNRASFGRMLTYFQVDARLFSCIDTVINEVLLHRDMLERWVGSDAYNWKLLYRGSRDGFSAASFHQKCDGSAETITVVRDINNSVFGGYVDTAWRSGNAWGHSTKAFLFSLSLAGASDPSKVKKCDIRAECAANAIYCHPSYGPTFGTAHDLFLVNECNVNNCTTNVSATYHNHGNAFLLTSQTFRVQEVEVFQRALTKHKTA